MRMLIADRKLITLHKNLMWKSKWLGKAAVKLNEVQVRNYVSFVKLINLHLPKQS